VWKEKINKKIREKFFFDRGVEGRQGGFTDEHKKGKKYGKGGYMKRMVIVFF